MRLNEQNPWELMSSLRRDVDRLFGTESDQGFTPTVDIFEEDTRYVVLADLPGIDAKELELTVDGNILTIKGERKLDDRTASVMRRSERRHGSFERHFRLPETAANEGLAAGYNDGVLTVSIPKIEQAVPYRIEVTAN